jgi:hypothetical protein
MRKFLCIGLLATTPWAFAAQEARALPEFKSIKSQGVYTLVVTAGQKQSVVVDGDDSALARLSTTVVGDELVIAMPEKKKSFGWSDRVTITITVPELTRMHLEGVGGTTLKQLAGESFELTYQGVGSTTVDGKVRHFVLKAEGVGTLNARELDAQYVDARLAGVGSAKVRASESLTARVEGIGSLTYYGKPTKVTKSADGIGTVHAAE